MKTLILTLLACPVYAQDFHATIGSMSINGASGRGTVFEIGGDFADRALTVALIKNQEYATTSNQFVESGLSGYATFNVIRSDKWKLGIGAAYLDYQTSDVHNLRALFGVPPVIGRADKFAPALTITRSFGPLILGLRHFQFRTSGGWVDTSSVSTISAGVGF